MDMDLSVSIARPAPRARPAVFHFEPTSGEPHVRAFRLDPAHAKRFLTPHAHQFFEVLYFEEAGGTHRLGGDVWESTAGDLIAIAPGQVHEWGPHVLARTPRVWILEFTAAAVAPTDYAEGSLLGLLLHPLLTPFSYGSRPGPLRLKVPAAERAGWLAELSALQAERAAHHPHWEEAVHAKLVLLLIQLYRLTCSARTPPAVQSQPLLRQTFEVIDARFAEGISLADVARAVHHSPPYLTTTIRRLTGRTVGDWITERRMAEARRLLIHTELSVAQIAAKTGYSDPAHFVRQFRKATASPPGAWRQANR